MRRRLPCVGIRGNAGTAESLVYIILLSVFSVFSVVKLIGISNSTGSRISLPLQPGYDAGSSSRAGCWASCVSPTYDYSAFSVGTADGHGSARSHREPCS